MPSKRKWIKRGNIPVYQEDTWQPGYFWNNRLIICPDQLLYVPAFGAGNCGWWFLWHWLQHIGWPTCTTIILKVYPNEYIRCQSADRNSTFRPITRRFGARRVPRLKRIASSKLLFRYWHTLRIVMVVMYIRKIKANSLNYCPNDIGIDRAIIGELLFAILVTSSTGWPTSAYAGTFSLANIIVSKKFIYCRKLCRLIRKLR